MSYYFPVIIVRNMETVTTQHCISIWKSLDITILEDIREGFIMAESDLWYDFF